MRNLYETINETKEAKNINMGESYLIQGGEEVLLFIEFIVS